VFHGSEASEAIHWQRFPVAPRLHHFIFARGTHNIARTLQKRNRMSEVVKLAIEQRSRLVRKTLERTFLKQRARVLRREEFEAEYPDHLVQLERVSA